MRMLDGMGTRSLKYADAICRLNDGKVGQAINDLAVWWVSGVAGGIHEGFGEGIVMLGNRKNSRSTNNDEI